MRLILGALCILAGVQLRELTGPLVLGQPAASAADQSLAPDRAADESQEAEVSAEIFDALREVLGSDLSDAYLADLLRKSDGDVGAAAEAFYGRGPSPDGHYSLVSDAFSSELVALDFHGAEVGVSRVSEAAGASLAPHTWLVKGVDGVAGAFSIANEDPRRTPRWMTLDVWSRLDSEDAKRSVERLAHEVKAALNTQDLDRAAELHERLQVARDRLSAANPASVLHSVIAFKPNGAENQRWAFHADGTIESLSSGRVLDVRASTADPATYDISLSLRRPKEPSATQRWRLVRRRQSHGDL